MEHARRSARSRVCWATAETAELVLEHHMVVLDANLKKLLDPEQKQTLTGALIRDLLTTLKMEPLGELSIYDAVDLRAPGWSFVQAITTSHISGHYFEKPGRLPHVHLDIYTCKPLQFEQVLRVVDHHLHLANWVGTFICRDMDLGQRRTWELQGFGGELLHRWPMENPLRQTEAQAPG